jgi:hypothetical protein
MKAARDGLLGERSFKYCNFVISFRLNFAAMCCDCENTAKLVYFGLFVVYFKEGNDLLKLTFFPVNWHKKRSDVCRQCIGQG